MPKVTFYFDLGSPFAYLAAERIRALCKLASRSSWAVGDYERRQAGMAEIERRAQSYGFPPIRWPDPWPTNYLTAMRAATYTFTIGKGRDFTLQAFRNAFQHGRDLSITANVLETGEQAGIQRDRLNTGTRDPQIKKRCGERPIPPFSSACMGFRPSRSTTSCPGGTTGSRTPPLICSVQASRLATLKTTPSQGPERAAPPREKRGAAISSWPSGATATEQMGHGRPQNPDGAVLDRSCPVRPACRGRAACCSRWAQATAEPSRTKPQGWATATRGR